MKPSRVGGPTPKTHLFRGRYMTAKEIAAITGKHVNLIHQRIRQGRPLDVDRKPGVPPRLYVFGDERLTLNEIASRLGLTWSGVYRRISGDRVFNDDEMRAMPRGRMSKSTIKRRTIRVRNRKIIRRIAFTFGPGINLNEVLTAADFMVNDRLTGGYPTTSPCRKGPADPGTRDMPTNAPARANKSLGSPPLPRHAHDHDHR